MIYWILTIFANATLIRAYKVFGNVLDLVYHGFVIPKYRTTAADDQVEKWKWNVESLRKFYPNQLVSIFGNTDTQKITISTCLLFILSKFTSRVYFVYLSSLWALSHNNLYNSNRIHKKKLLLKIISGLSFYYLNTVCIMIKQNISYFHCQLMISKGILKNKSGGSVCFCLVNFGRMWEMVDAKWSLSNF